jgi:hypothetical protein
MVRILPAIAAAALLFTASAAHAGGMCLVVIPSAQLRINKGEVDGVTPLLIKEKPALKVVFSPYGAIKWKQRLDKLEGKSGIPIIVGKNDRLMMSVPERKYRESNTIFVHLPNEKEDDPINIAIKDEFLKCQ